MCLRVGKLVDSSLDIQAIQLPALQYQHERRSHDWMTDDSSSVSGMTDVTDFTDSGTLISEDGSNIKLNIGVSGRFRPHSSFKHLATCAEFSVYSQARLYLQQFYAMFLKRALYSWRNWKVMVAQFLVPLIFIALALVVARTLPGSHSSPQLRLSLAQYGPTHVPVALGADAGPLAEALAEVYTAQLASQNAIAAMNITGNAGQVMVCKTHFYLFSSSI